MKKHLKIRQRVPRKPIGMLCGILATCLAITIGLASGLDPYTICFRASICGIVFGISVRIFVDFIRIANIPSGKVKESQ